MPAADLEPLLEAPRAASYKYGKPEFGLQDLKKQEKIGFLGRICHGRPKQAGSCAKCQTDLLAGFCLG